MPSYTAILALSDPILSETPAVDTPLWVPLTILILILLMLLWGLTRGNVKDENRPPGSSIADDIHHNGADTH